MSYEERYHVGTLHVKEARKVTELFECAAWERHVEVPPGDYPVYCYPYWPEKNPGHSLYAEVEEGTIVYATFQSRIGAHYGSDHGSEEVGRTKKTSITIPTYAMHKYVESGELELIEGRMVARPHTSAEGKSYVFYRMGERNPEAARPRRQW
jgi:hypothetical protein